jgi:V8-like Glu-specific endopeptidase
MRLRSPLSSLLSPVSCLLSIVAVGCDSPSASTPRPATVAGDRAHDDLVPGHEAPYSEGPTAVPEDWIGYELGVAAPTVIYLGQAELSEDGPDLVREGPGNFEVDDLGLDLQDFGPDYLVWAEINVASGEMYQFAMLRSDAEVVHSFLAEHGYDKARGPGGEVLADSEVGSAADLPDAAMESDSTRLTLQADVPRASDSEDTQSPTSFTSETPPPQHTWSNGVDSRTKRAVADGYSTNHFPYRTIAHMSAGSGCTGTLIGQKVLLTAAHCLYASGSYFNHNIRPRRDPSVASPYGTSGTARLWIRDSYLNGSCGTSENCNKYDIAIAELTSNQGDQTGALGFAATTTTDTTGFENVMRGYPSCLSGQSWSSSRPDPCTPFALYGSLQTCYPSDFHSGGCWSDGWYCEFEATCDGSPGQSGSAVYTHDVPGFGGNPVALGVYSQYNCVPPNCDDKPHPNEFTRITPDTAYLISLSKSLWGSW